MHNVSIVIQYHGYYGYVIMLRSCTHNNCDNLSISETRLADIWAATVQETQLQQLKQLLDRGWPANLCNVPEALCHFWNVKENLCMADDFILKGDRIVIPSSRQNMILKAIHEGHLGIEKCKARARMCIYWPNINEAIEKMVRECSKRASTSALSSTVSVVQSWS